MAKWSLSDQLPPLWTWTLVQCERPQWMPDLQAALRRHCIAHAQAMNSTLRRMEVKGYLRKIEKKDKVLWKRTALGKRHLNRNLRFLRWATKQLPKVPTIRTLKT